MSGLRLRIRKSNVGPQLELRRGHRLQLNIVASSHGLYGFVAIDGLATRDSNGECFDFTTVSLDRHDCERLLKEALVGFDFARPATIAVIA